MAKQTKTYSIYSIRNKVNGKRYIGLSHKPLKRIYCYSPSQVIYKALCKYGHNNFTQRILQSNLTLKQAQNAERKYIKKYNSIVPNGYNLCAGGEGVFNPTKEVRYKIGKGNRGKHITKKHKKLLKEINIGNKNASGKRTGQILKNIQKGLQNRTNKKLEIQKAVETKRKNGYIKPTEIRICGRGNCNKTFECKINSRRKYCSKSCAKIGWIPDSKWRKTISKRMKKNSPMKNPKIKLKFAKRYLKNAKQRLIKARNFPQYKINGIKRQISHIQKSIKELNLLICNNQFSY